MRERDLARKILQWAKKQEDIFIFKTYGSPYQRAGIPDLVGNVGRLAFYVELKVGNNKMSLLQASTGDKILRSGASFCVVREVDQFIKVVNTLRAMQGQD